MRHRPLFLNWLPGCIRVKETECSLIKQSCLNDDETVSLELFNKYLHSSLCPRSLYLFLLLPGSVRIPSPLLHYSTPVSTQTFSSTFLPSWKFKIVPLASQLSHALITIYFCLSAAYTVPRILTPYLGSVTALQPSNSYCVSVSEAKRFVSLPLQWQ